MPYHWRQWQSSSRVRPNWGHPDHDACGTGFIARLGGHAGHDIIDYALTALHAATAASGSLVIALALLEGRVHAGEAFAASQLDESFQIEAWGEDAEQTERRAALAADIAAAARFMTLLRG